MKLLLIRGILSRTVESRSLPEPRDQNYSLPGSRIPLPIMIKLFCMKPQILSFESESRAHFYELFEEEGKILTEF